MSNRTSQLAADLSQKGSGDRPFTAAAASHFLQLAERALAGEDPASARDILQGVVLANPDHADAWALLGQAERSLEQLENAREAFATAVSLDGGDIASGLSMAECCLALGDHAQAQALAGFFALNYQLSGELLLRAGAVLGDRPPSQRTTLRSR